MPEDWKYALSLALPDNFPDTLLIKIYDAVEPYVAATVPAADSAVEADRDELSATIEKCHHMLDLVTDEYEEGTTTLTPLDTRLEEFLWPKGRITDDMVNGDD